MGWDSVSSTIGMGIIIGGINNSTGMDGELMIEADMVASCIVLRFLSILWAL